jgi:peptidoglycan/xylan/chitin deacetylase (PgdA/CDA1 family)
MNRVVLFTSGAQDSVRIGLAELLRTAPETEWLVVQHRPRRTWHRLWRSQWKNLRRHGWRWIPYETADVLGRLRHRVPLVVGEKPAPGGAYEWAAILADPRVRLHTTPALHAEATLQTVRDFAPDLGLVLAAPVLKPPLFEIPRLGTINLHKGLLPDFRGMPPAFWELYTGGSELGCTIHRVEAGLDTGPVLLQRRLPRRPHATVRGAALELDRVGVEMTCEAVGLMLGGAPSWTPQGTGGRTFTKPTLAQEAELRRRLRTPHPERAARRWMKSAAFTAYTHLIRPIPRRFLAARGHQRVVVFCYHRVNDDLRDSLTVGVEQFDEQMRFLAARYPLASIEDVIGGTLSRHTSRPVVAITFDDGYLDNWEFAAPILARHRIPAAFFVSTGMIGTTRGFDHDRERLGRTLATMNWDHLRRMRDLGFTIGSHTVTHINCARVDRETLRRELVESRDSLRERLGVERPIFAYPFGKREDITPEGLALVRELGYSGCLSAYGGANDGPIDAFRIRRQGVVFGASLAGFQALVEGFSR